MPPVSFTPESMAAASATRVGSAAPVQTMPGSRGPSGMRRASRVRMVSSRSSRGMPASRAASAAIWAGPMALVAMARRSPRGGRARVRTSAAPRKSARPRTRRMPARRRAASKTASARPVGSVRRPPERMATTGRRRAAARAAEMKVRRSRMVRMSSRMAPVPGSRESQSSTRLNPVWALPPVPTTWLKPTPLGAAQSSTARQSAADCETRATLPGRTGRWAVEALRPIAGTMRPKEAGPRTRMPAAWAAASRFGAGVVQTATVVPAAAMAARAGATWWGTQARTARSWALAGMASGSAVVKVPWKAAMLAAMARPVGVSAPTRRTLLGVKRASGRKPLVRPGRSTGGKYCKLGGYASREGLFRMRRLRSAGDQGGV